MLARLLGRVYRVPEAIALLEPLVTRDGARAATASEMRDIELTLAGLYDLEGRTDRAFACRERANGRRAAVFDAARLDAQVDALIGSPPATARPRPTRIERPEPDLLFIVVLPHAGARLVEQVLASQRASPHPAGGRPSAIV